MNIAIVIERFDPALGGREKSTLQIARELINRGHRVTVLCNAAGGEGAALHGMPSGAFPGAGAQVIAAGGLSTKYALGLWRFRRWACRKLDAGPFDVSLSVTLALPAAVVETRDGTVRESLSRRMAMKSGLARVGAKLLLLTRPKQLMWLRLERQTLRDPRVRRIVAISRYAADQLSHHYAVDDSRVTVIPNAAEVRRFDPEERGLLRAERRASLNLAAGDVAFLFAAMNPPLKGLPFLLQAVQRIAAEQPRVRLIVAGSDPADMRALSQQLGIADRVRWVGPTREMDSLYAAADVVVLPSWFDPSSKVVLESLLHGIPAISTLHNGASEWIFSPSGVAAPPSAFSDEHDEPEDHDLHTTEQRAGRVIRSADDVAGLAQAMTELCDDVERARCAAAAASVGPQITMARHVDELEKVLAEVAAAKRLSQI